MNHKKYLFSDERLIIKEPSLGIFIDATFHMKMINPEMDNCLIEKNGQGAIIKAYFIEDGLLDGQMKLFYESGTLKAEMYYKKGLLYGPSSFFSENHQILSVTWYYAGKKEGISYKYYIDGSLYAEEKYLDGFLQGTQKYYDENGKIKTELSYEKGRPHGVAVLYWRNGQLKRKVAFQHGLKHGEEKIWDQEGNLTDHDYYEFGEKKSSLYTLTQLKEDQARV